MITQPGGAGTHYGIVYQTLSTIDAAFTIASRGEEADPDTITLIVEPRGGGGDLIASTDRTRQVLQFKARGDHRTWSLNEIIDDALSDLYRAVRPEPDAYSEYLLITEGREGEIGEARAFCRELNRDRVPDDPLSALDDSELRQYFPSASPMTGRKFFDDHAATLPDLRRSRTGGERIQARLVASGALRDSSRGIRGRRATGRTTASRLCRCSRGCAAEGS